MPGEATLSIVQHPSIQPQSLTLKVVNIRGSDLNYEEEDIEIDADAFDDEDDENYDGENSSDMGSIFDEAN